MSFVYPKPMPKWVSIALSFMGQSEIPGKKTAPFISKMLTRLKAWWADDETPWCGVFVGYCMSEAGYAIPKLYMRAKEWNTWGYACNKTSIPFGAVCTKTRVGGGHVFFAVAISRDGRIVYGAGGNQRNMVSIVPFSIDEIDHVRFPDAASLRLQLPIATADQLKAMAGGGSEA